jgi:hypothetical protein
VPSLFVAGSLVSPLPDTAPEPCGVLARDGGNHAGHVIAGLEVQRSGMQLAIGGERSPVGRLIGLPGLTLPAVGERDGAPVSEFQVESGEAGNMPKRCMERE